MLKVKIPLSFVALLVVFVSPVAGLVLAAAAEMLVATLLIRRLQSEDEFDYDSIYGMILSQYSLGDTEPMDIVTLMIARISSYLLAGGILFFSLSGRWLVIPATLYILAITHRI